MRHLPLVFQFPPTATVNSRVPAATVAFWPDGLIDPLLCRDVLIVLLVCTSCTVTFLLLLLQLPVTFLLLQVFPKPPRHWCKWRHLVGCRSLAAATAAVFAEGGSPDGLLL